MRSTSTDRPDGGALASSLFDNAKADVVAFLESPALDAAAAAAFNVSRDALADAIGEFVRSGWPKLQVVDQDALGGANGAYDAAGDTIFLSYQFLARAGDSAVTAVLIEEIGHAIDARVNAADSAGDEGEIFARFVAGDTPGTHLLATLRAQDDHGTIVVNGSTVDVEFATNGSTAKVGIVYSETTAARYWGQMAYSQLFMAAQNQAMMAGVPFDILSEADLTDASKLAQYDALIFPKFEYVQASQVAAITSALTTATQTHGVALIGAGNFMTNDQTGAPLPGDSYSRMKAFFGLTYLDSDFPSNVTLTAVNSHPVMQDYGAGELIHNYSGVGWLAYTPSNALTSSVLAQQTIGSETFNAVYATTTAGGGRNVHFSTEGVMADHNLLWQAIDYSVNGTGVTAGLQLSRNASIVASRVDMDQAQQLEDVNPSDNSPGIYDVMMPIVQQWKAAYNYVASYYIDIGNDPASGEATNWAISGPYYAQLLALGNELGSHSYTHPHFTDQLSPAEIQFEFGQSRTVIEQQMSQVLGRPFTIDGAAVPGNPENLTTALEILKYYDYLSGGFSGVGAGYPGAFGYLTPAMATADKTYLAPNVSFDFSLVQFQGLTPAQASARWQQEFNKLASHADVPILLWPWHDYGPTDWDYGAPGDQSPYNTQMFTDFIAYAYNAGAEFVTLGDLAQRISAFEDASLSWSLSSNTVTATVTSLDAGRMALDLDNIGSQKIASVQNWYAYDDDSVFLDRDGGTFTITLGSSPTNVTRITALPMRSELVSLTGDGNHLIFRVIGEGKVTIDLASLTGKTLRVSGAAIQSQSGEILVLDLGAHGDHTVTVSLAAASGNSAPWITSGGGGAAAAISVAENTTAVMTVTASDPDAGQSRTFSIAGGADAARFTINATTGVLSFITAPDFEAPTDAGANNLYDVIVRVTDSGSGALSDTQAIAVTVRNVADSREHTDFNGDGKGDLTLTTTTGITQVWLTDGSHVVGSGTIAAIAPTWRLVDAEGDYNGDGRSDVLWRNTNGAVQVSLMQGTSTLSSTIIGAPDRAWSLVNAQADYNGDGKSDLLWRHSDGRISTWLMNGSQLLGSAILGAPSTDWNIISADADFNADGKSDILLRHRNGTVSISLVDGTRITHGYQIGAPDPSWTLLDAQGDYNGDGSNDLLWRHADGRVDVWLISGGQFLRQVAVGAPDVSWQLVTGHADFNGDGRSDILWRHADGRVSPWLITGSDLEASGGILGGPEAAWKIVDADSDYNGDGRTDVLWRHDNGTISTWLVSGSQVIGSGILGVLSPDTRIAGAGEHGATLVGTAAADVLGGTVARDMLVGGAGNDILTGGAGADTFVLSSPPNASSNVDTIVDFTPGSDVLLFSDVIFTALPAGPLSSASFVSSAQAAARDANDFVLYDTSTGRLFYDSDGAGAAAAILIAQLQNVPALAATDIFVGFM